MREAGTVDVMFPDLGEEPSRTKERGGTRAAPEPTPTRYNSELARSVLRQRMLARSGDPLRGRGYAFEVKRDWFRALVDTRDCYRLFSRRGWNWRACAARP